MSSPASLSTVANPLFGIGLKVLSVLIFVAMQVSLKGAGEEIPPGQMVFFRSLFALVPVAVYLAWRRELKTALYTRHFSGHMVRGVVGVSAMGLGFFALTRLPYAEWMALSYAAPLFTVVFAVIFLKEAVRPYRWGAVLAGLVGILIVSVPNFTALPVSSSGGHAIGVIAALGGATLAAVAMIQIRRLVASERTTTIVIYFSLTSSLLALFTLPFGWVWPTPQQAALLIMAGLCGGVAQLLLTACYRYADASTIAPFEYTSLVISVMIGSLVFGERIGVTTVIGGAIVVLSGVFIIVKERRLQAARLAARKVKPTQPD